VTNHSRADIAQLRTQLVTMAQALVWLDDHLPKTGNVSPSDRHSYQHELMMTIAHTSDDKLPNIVDALMLRWSGLVQKLVTERSQHDSSTSLLLTIIEIFAAPSLAKQVVVMIDHAQHQPVEQVYKAFVLACQQNSNEQILQSQYLAHLERLKRKRPELTRTLQCLGDIACMTLSDTLGVRLIHDISIGNLNNLDDLARRFRTSHLVHASPVLLSAVTDLTRRQQPLTAVRIVRLPDGRMAMTRD
jgi:hypothetical protein